MTAEARRAGCSRRSGARLGAGRRRPAPRLGGGRSVASVPRATSSQRRSSTSPGSRSATAPATGTAASPRRVGLDPLDPPARAPARARSASEPPRWAGARFAVALTHDVDSPWRWTPLGIRGAAARLQTTRTRGRAGAALREARRSRAFRCTSCAGTDPNWSFERDLPVEPDTAPARRSSSWRATATPPTERARGVRPAAAALVETLLGRGRDRAPRQLHGRRTTRASGRGEGAAGGARGAARRSALPLPPRRPAREPRPLAELGFMYDTARLRRTRRVSRGDRSAVPAVGFEPTPARPRRDPAGGDGCHARRGALPRPPGVEAERRLMRFSIGPPARRRLRGPLAHRPLRPATRAAGTGCTFGLSRRFASAAASACRRASSRRRPRVADLERLGPGPPPAPLPRPPRLAAVRARHRASASGRAPASASGSPQRPPASCSCPERWSCGRAWPPPAGTAIVGSVLEPRDRLPRCCSPSRRRLALADAPHVAPSRARAASSRSPSGAGGRAERGRAVLALSARASSSAASSGGRRAVWGDALFHLARVRKLDEFPDLARQRRERVPRRRPASGLRVPALARRARADREARRRRSSLVVRICPRCSPRSRSWRPTPPGGALPFVGAAWRPRRAGRRRRLPRRRHGLVSLAALPASAARLLLVPAVLALVFAAIAGAAGSRSGSAMARVRSRSRSCT